MEGSNTQNLDIASISGILRPLVEMSLSIYLTGSFANNEVHSGSDIDLILVISDKVDRKECSSKLGEVIRNSNLKNRALDTSIYTNRELEEDLRSTNHFKIWSSLNNGILLFGDEILVELNVSLLFQSMIEWLNRLDEVASFIEMRVRYSACCYDLYSALVWFYFIDRYFIRSQKKTMTKNETLRNHFSSCFESVSETYERIVKQYRSERLERLKVKDSDSVNRYATNQDCLLNAWDSISIYCQQIYKKVISCTSF